MPNLLMLKGLPGSGKSTFARELTDYKRVNKDLLREMLDYGRWSRANEKMVLNVRDFIITEALEAGYNVVVDDTNLAPKHEAHLRELARIHKATFDVKFFDVPLEECIKRDLKRTNSVGKDVIVNMYNQFLKPKPEVYVPPIGKPKAIICDIDGTLAHMNGKRGPFDWDKVGSDKLDETVLDILNKYFYDQNTSYYIILLSGRDSICREQTENWLVKNDVSYDHLWMRPNNDNRKDAIVKRELFDKYIRDNYQVQFVLDDRDQMIECWRSMGLKALQVADGNF